MPAKSLFREYKLSVGGDLEDSTTRWDQYDLLKLLLASKGNTELLNQCFRQTDGARRVVSGHTEFYGDSHRLIMCSFLS